MQRQRKKTDVAQLTNSAFIDAVGGVAATVVTVWTFYPLDLWKTKLQAGGTGPHPVDNEREPEAHATGKELQRARLLFKGVGVKTIHSIGSSFCYFYIYSWIVARYRRRRTNDLATSSAPLSPAMGLLLSALAAAANTCITLPLDVISTRRQTDNEVAKGYIGQVSSTRRDNDKACQQSVPIWTKIRRAKTLWRGLVPSLILCSNPAINFTVFDVIKSIRLRKKTTHSDKLSMLEAFLLGLVAKFVATMITYPLIRAKVKIMASEQPSLLNCLKEHYEQGGVSELYRGCNLQLLHTVLKSALMMMIKERISHSTRLWLRPRTQS